MSASGSSRNYPLLPSHEKALWRNLAADEVTLSPPFSLFFYFVCVLFLIANFECYFTIFENFFIVLCKNWEEIHLNLADPPGLYMHVKFKTMGISSLLWTSSVP